MKTLLKRSGIIAAIILAVTVISFAQQPIQLMVGRTFVDSQKDTLLFSPGIRMANLASIEFYLKDSCKADIVIEGKKDYDTVWTSLYTDSLINTVQDPAVLDKEIVLRDGTLDRIPQLTGAIRCRVSHRSAGAGKTTPKEYAYLRYR